MSVYCCFWHHGISKCCYAIYEKKLYWKPSNMLRLYNNDMIWEWKCFNLHASIVIGIHSLWLHHMYWCGVLGEDYDGFIRVMNSNLFLLTRMIVVSLCFPKFSQRGFYGVLYWMSAHWWWFCPSIFPMGVSGFIFHGAIQSGILRFGIPFWLEGSVWWYCWAICRARKEGIT